MILKNIHIRIFVSLLFCLTHIKAKPETIKIINKTDSALNVNFTVPEQTVASIKLKKLDDLHDAIVADSSEKIRKAVLDGADVNHLKDGKTPLLWAIILQHYNAIETLLHLGAKPDDTCVTQVIKMQDIKCLLSLVRHGITNLDLKKTIAILSTSIIHGNLDSIALIRELVSRGYNANEFWHSATTLTHCKPIEAEEIVRFLLSRGANPNYINTYDCYTRTPLMMAVVYYPNKQIVKILIDAGADINTPIQPNLRSPEQSLLSYAIEFNKNGSKERKEVIALLLEQGASL
jgi:ankyrin repeat protein